MKEELLRLGKKITTTRKAKGFSLRDLAATAEISKGNLSDIERGNRDPRYSTLLAIATALEMPVTELIRRDA